MSSKQGKEITIRSVSELLGDHYFIPSYQRGYRWTPRQVRDLLDDLKKFHLDSSKDTDAWYCLQPLVVMRMTEGRLAELEWTDSPSAKDEWFEVIDGQQRLTTIYIILNCMSESNYHSLRYQTRPESENFLAGIRTNSDGSKNIDFDYMIKAKDTVMKFMDEIEKCEQESLLATIRNRAKVIWYEIADSKPHEAFKRLNSGKIPLSNAELIKGLLLNGENLPGLSGAEAKLSQLEKAAEWDRIEQRLHDDAFWYFINPDPYSPKYDATRIDFLFELMMCAGSKTSADYPPYRVGIRTYNKERIGNQYYAFFMFSSFVEQGEEAKNAEFIWSDLQSIYRKLYGWYKNREYYHYIGYLVAREKNKSLLPVIDLLEFSGLHSEFKNKLQMKCASTIKGKTEEALDVGNLKYSDKNRDYRLIENILLLFNLATVQFQESEQSRYPFDLHRKEHWSLEHIHARNERRAKWKEEEVEVIKKYLNKTGNAKLADHITPGLLQMENSACYAAVVNAFECNRVIDVVKNDDGSFSYTNTSQNDWYDESIMNLALLQGDKNSELNDRLYPEKKVIIANYETTFYDNSTHQRRVFIPICTRNAFFKHYSPGSINPFLWDEADGRAYLNTIVQTVALYTGLEAIKENNDIVFNTLKKGAART